MIKSKDNKEAKAAREKRISELQKKSDLRDAQMAEMQKAFTNLANNYSEFIGKMNKIIDKCEPLLDATISEKSNP